MRRGARIYRLPAGAPSSIEMTTPRTSVVVQADFVRGTWALVVAALISGCAMGPQKSWFRDGASSQDFAMDQGQCQSQAYSIPNAPMLQISMVFSACMRGKGWSWQ